MIKVIGSYTKIGEGHDFDSTHIGSNEFDSSISKFGWGRNELVEDDEISMVL